MLDERTGALLGKINEICGAGGFKIAEEGELLSCLGAGATREELVLKLGELRDCRYIDIRYAEEGVYCVCPLPAGKRYFEDLVEKRRAGVRRRADLFLFSLLGSFLGSVAGAFLVRLILLLAEGA